MLAVTYPWAPASSYLSSQSVADSRCNPHSCHPAVFLLSSFSLPSLLPLSLHSPLPRSAAPLLPVGPLLSRLLLPLGAVPLSSLRIVAPQVYPAHLSRFCPKKERKKTDNPREGWEDGTPPPHRDFLRRGECGASRRPPLGVCLFLSLFAVCRRFSLQPSCHPAVFLLSCSHDEKRRTTKR